ncbi:tetratricopeptide repeat protein [Halobacteriovorax sp. JY17]|uniref:tetratricopeptide repeat protein n=1 Tax=Halobacteriovorax sp. JY17 TaxID=2014617 RepID=UPI000C3C506E|nr:tetratricopeptide repeat protein [Halobacteriovorax sp. JY17]PIK15398.1 MAG: hypothetical protein CES88_01390 [Halobacteriovorax sp. JY17]
MKVAILLTIFLAVSCGSHKINSHLQSKNDAFSEESFMRFGNTRLSKISEENFLNKSLSKCYNGDFKSSLQDLQSNINKYREDKKYWLFIGICYQLYGNQLKANYFYDYALSGENLIQASIYNNKALVALKSSNFEDAHTLLEKSIKLSPNSKVPKYNLAQVYIKFNHLEKARTLIHPLVTSNPNDIDLILSMMTIEIAEGNFTKAYSWAKRFNDENLKREDISLYVALLYYELKRYEEAKAIIGGQRATIIEEIKSATNALSNKINIELERIKEEKDSKDANVKKGVKRVAVKN